MFFNKLVNAAEELQLTPELDSQLRSGIKEPSGEENASTVLETFRNYVARLSVSFVEAGGEPRSKPNQNSVPFFLSYFWQIQNHLVWPVYYTSAVQVLQDMNLWQPSQNVGADYLAYKKLHEDLAAIFSEEFKRMCTLYDVEHVFWFKSGRLGAEMAPIESGDVAAAIATQPQPNVVPAAPQMGLPYSYVPPIVAIIPRLAANDPLLQEEAQKLGTTLERIFENNINAALTMLGYETQLLGQGKGRVPDGQAVAIDESYALVWDAKARSEAYRMGTDDRIIRQYIDLQSRNLKRSRGIRNIYYLIFSKAFADESDDLVASLKMDTHVNEVCFVEATALVELVNQRLRAPLNVGLGPDGIQRLFSSGGIITTNDVLEILAV